MFTTSVRVDASPEIGLGHLRRCLTLADELRDRCSEVRLIFGAPLHPSVEALIGSYRRSWIASVVPTMLDDDSDAAELLDAEATLALMGQPSAEGSWVIVDSYRLGHAWERGVRQAGHRVLAIDDFRNRRHCADLLVSDSLTPFDSTSNEPIEDARQLTGREYALIGREYRYSGPSFSQRPRPTRVLVSYGGSDPTSETLKAVEAIGLVRGTPAARLLGDVAIVIGQLNSMNERIDRAVSGMPNVVTHRAPATLAPLMRHADLILTSAGNSMAEALALRKPCLVTVTARNQAFTAAELADDGAIRLINAGGNVGVQDMATAIVEALTDYEGFAAAVAAHAYFDDLGASRIASAMCGQITEANRPTSEVARIRGALG